MKVKDLIKKLKKIDPDMEVWSENSTYGTYFEEVNSIGVEKFDQQELNKLKINAYYNGIKNTPPHENNVAILRFD